MNLTKRFKSALKPLEAHPWTYPLIFNYYRCPSCGWIAESRLPFILNEGVYQKSLTCTRCSHPFTLSWNKPYPPRSY